MSVLVVILMVLVKMVIGENNQIFKDQVKYFEIKCSLRQILYTYPIITSPTH